MIIAIVCILGIVVNFLILDHEMAKAAEGGMGMGIFMLLCFIPWSMPVLGAVVWLVSLGDSE